MEKKVIEALNEQINFELYSAYIYLNLSLLLEEKNYKGYSAFLAKHYEEELDHAKQFIDYMHKRGVKPTLKDIHMEEFSDMEPVEVAKIVLEHEMQVTKRIFDIHDVSKNEDDYATEIFMHQFIEEQIEEEDLAREIVDNFTLACDNLAARMIVDKELSSK